MQVIASIDMIVDTTLTEEFHYWPAMLIPPLLVRTDVYRATFAVIELAFRQSVKSISGHEYGFFVSCDASLCRHDR